MDVREKLVEILREPIFPHELVDPVEAVADYLLDSGVTVQKWIPASDPPEESGEYLVMIRGGASPTSLLYEEDTGAWFECVIEDGMEERQYYAVTHWMSLPSTPKGELP